MAPLAYVIDGVVAGGESKNRYKYRISMEYIPKLFGRTFALWFDFRRRPCAYGLPCLHARIRALPAQPGRFSGRA